jgi:putative acetyltransferase
VGGDERAAIVHGLSAYARALARVRAQRDMTIRPIAAADDPAVARIIRTVMTEHGAGGPGFAIHDAEVSAMSRAYRGARARYFVLEKRGRVVGGAGFASLAGGRQEVCELRKMYFLPEARGAGMGRKLLEHTLAAATRAGYRSCYLETLRTMVQARALYESAGFQRIDRPLGSTGHFGCDAWYEKPL